MPAAIPEIIKSKVIQQWLQGLGRDDIARANSVSAGAVSNIIKEWKLKLGEYDAEAFRELARALKSNGLSPSQCAIGLRLTRILEGEGIDVENSDVEGYIRKKSVENKGLDDRRQELNRELSAITRDKVEAARSYHEILEKGNKAGQELSLFFEAKQELDKHNISIAQDLPRFAKMVKAISEYRFDPLKVLNEFKDLLYYVAKKRALEIAADEAQKDLTRTKQENSLIQEAIRRRSFDLSVYDELDRAGLGAYELRRLLRTILSIAGKNGISYWQAVSKFFDDVETQYDSKLGFEAEKDRLNSEIQILKEKRNEELGNLRDRPFIGPIISRLIQLGLTEDNILECSKMLLNLFKGPYSVKNIALGMTETVKAMITSRTRTFSGDRTIEILDRAREELSKLN